jgi:hypothetical protein
VDQQNDAAITTATHGVDLGRVIVNSPLGTQNVTINKTGLDGTYFEVRTDGAATSTVSGRYNAFPMDNAAAFKVTTLGLSASTATAGLKSGSVTVDNLDITTQGGTGVGVNDPDDVISPMTVTMRGTVAVPEPGTVALLATGLLGLTACAWRMRRRRRAA